MLVAEVLEVAAPAAAQRAARTAAVLAEAAKEAAVYTMLTSTHVLRRIHS